VLYTLAITVFWAVSGFTVFTYLSAPLHMLGFSSAEISFGLLIFGSASAIGNLLGGALADRLGAVPTAALSLAALMIVLTLQSVVMKYVPPEYARSAFVGLLFCWGLAGWAFYPAQVANLLTIETSASTIALSLNASAMYFGFAAGGALGGVVLATLTPSDLGWVGGCAVAVAVALILSRGRREVPKLSKIAG
jgi:predicted MFS family arabinose efflux permease